MAVSSTLESNATRKKVDPIPQGFHTTTPHLIVRDAIAAIDFYKKAFNAEEMGVMRMPDGKVMHAMIRIGDSFVMLADECPEWGAISPATLGNSPVTVHLYVEDVDSTFNQAVAAGGKPLMPPMNAFWGDRYGKITDPQGHHWSLATHIEDVPQEEMPKRAADACAQTAAQQNK